MQRLYKRRPSIITLLVVLLTDGLARVSQTEKPAFTFRDVTKGVGLLPDITGIKGHAAGWGDVDGDGWLDLYVSSLLNNYLAEKY